MRLFIAIVFLIGAMFATEAICFMELEAAILRTWFDQTLVRLERGQTLIYNRNFINVTFENANQLLRLLSYPKFVVGMPDDNILNNDDLYDYLIKSDKVLINQIDEVHNVDPHPNDRAIVHVKHILQAIKQVLRGDLTSARVEIAKSVAIFKCSLTPNDEITFNKVTGLPGSSRAGRGLVLEKSDHYFNGSVNQTSSIRAWLRVWLSVVHDPPRDKSPRMVRFFTALSEIAQALVNSPATNLPSVVLKFIGRYPVEKLSDIANRIDYIETQIISSNKDVMVMKAVLNAIVEILRLDFVEAKRLIDESIGQHQYILNDTDDSFIDEMTKAYQLEGY